MMILIFHQANTHLESLFSKLKGNKNMILYILAFVKHLKFNVNYFLPMYCKQYVMLTHCLQFLT